MSRSPEAQRAAKETINGESLHIAPVVEFPLSAKPWHDYVRSLSRAVSAYQKVGMLETEMQNTQSLLHTQDPSRVPKELQEAVNERLRKDREKLVEASAQFRHLLERVQNPPSAGGAPGRSDQPALHARVLNEVNSLKGQVSELKARLNITRPRAESKGSADSTEEGEIREGHIDIPMDVDKDEQAALVVQSEQDVEMYKRKLEESITALTVQLANIEAERLEERLVELDLQSPRVLATFAQASSSRLEHLETSLAAAKEEVRTLKVAAAAVRTRAETAESENNLLRQANTSLRESNEHLEERLREVQEQQRAKMGAMQEEIRELSGAVAHLAGQPPPPIDPAHVAEALMPQAREAVREEITQQFEKAVQELQQGLQNNSRDTLDRLASKMDVTAEYADILMKVLKGFKESADRTLRP